MCLMLLFSGRGWLEFEPLGTEETCHMRVFVHGDEELDATGFARHVEDKACTFGFKLIEILIAVDA